MLLYSQRLVKEKKWNVKLRRSHLSQLCIYTSAFTHVYTYIHYTIRAHTHAQYKQYTNCTHNYIYAHTYTSKPPYAHAESH